MRPSTFLLSSLLSVACFPELAMSPAGTAGTAGADGGEEGGEEVDRLELEIKPAEPYHGSTAGGLETYLRGGPFDESVQVWFGDELAQVVGASENELRVVVPPHLEEGAITVTAMTDTHEGSVGPGFRYWEDQSDQIVMTGVMLQWEWAGPGDEIRWAQAALLQTVPGAWSVLDAFAQVGSCSESTESLELVEMPEEAEFVSDGTRIALSPQEAGQGLYYYEEGGSTSLASREFSLDIPTGTYPEIVLDQGLAMSEGIRLTTPVIETEYTWDYDYMDIGSGPFRWSGGVGEYVLLSIYDSADTSRLVNCILDRDAGSHQISAGMLHAAGFASDTACGLNLDWDYVCGDEFGVYIRLVDLVLTENALEFNHGISEMWGGTGVLGFSHLWEEN